MSISVMHMSTLFVLVMSTLFCMIEPPQCYGEVQHTTAVTRTSCVGQPFCKHQPGTMVQTHR